MSWVQARIWEGFVDQASFEPGAKVQTMTDGESDDGTDIVWSMMNMNQDYYRMGEMNQKVDAKDRGDACGNEHLVSVVYQW